MKEYIEERMRAKYLSGASKEELDSFMNGVLETLYSLGTEPPMTWVVNYMAHRVDRLYMTDEEWDAINVEE